MPTAGESKPHSSTTSVVKYFSGDPVPDKPGVVTALDLSMERCQEWVVPSP